jgi:hypothetical protein
LRVTQNTCDNVLARGLHGTGFIHELTVPGIGMNPALCRSAQA